MNNDFPVQEGGTYILLLHNKARQTLEIGRLGEFQFKRGYYLYVGSAFGPGGLSSRVGRHLAVNKKLRWHIDYLTTQFATREVWYSTSDQRLECQWSRNLSHMTGGENPIKGLGSSDCSCYSHLFYFANKPKLEDFQIVAKDPISKLRKT